MRVKKKYTPEEMSARYAVRRIRKAVKSIVLARDTNKIIEAGKIVNEGLRKIIIK